jgi:hypothetical protein
VQTPDDEQFEASLKRFHPIAPEPIPASGVGRQSQRVASLGSWLVAVAAVVILVVVSGSLILRTRSNRVVALHKTHYVAVAERHAPAEPFTMRSANAWLVAAPSFKAAVDDLAFNSQTSTLTEGKQSVVAVLSKEKIRL